MEPRLTMVEFPSADPAASAEFFQSVFGWNHQRFGDVYFDVAVGGVSDEPTLGFQGDRGEAPAAPLVIIEVDDLAASSERIVAAGGVVTREEFSFPGGRRFHFREPGGNELAVWVPE